MMEESRLAYALNCLKNDEDVVRLSVSGTPCPACAKYENRLFSLTGKTKGLPTWEELKRDGVFHAGCTHCFMAVGELTRIEDYYPDGFPKKGLNAPARRRKANRASLAIHSGKEPAMANQEVTVKVETVKKKKRGCCGVLVLAFLIVIVIGAISSSSSKKETAPPAPAEQPRRPPVKPETPAPPPAPEQSVPEEPVTPPEPPRDELETLREKYEQEIRAQLPFTAPQVGDEVAFRIDDGKEMKGKIYRLTGKNIRFGSEDVQMTLDWDRLVPADRLQLDPAFYEEYVKKQSLEQARMKLAAIEKGKQEKEARAARQRAERAAERKVQANASKFRKAFESYDGSVRPVVAAVKSTMHDPGSFEHVKTDWYILKGTTDQYLVKMSFRGKNAFGGKVLNKVDAVCRLDGTIVSIENVE